MNGANGQNTRGNRFFLPKIEYSRLESHSRLTPDLEVTSNREDVKNKEESRRFELFETPSNISDQTAATFTKFSVLPPIRHHGSTRGKYLRDLEKTRSDDRYDELKLEGRRRSNSLRRQTALLPGEGEVTKKINTGENDFQIIGQRFTGVSSRIRRENDSLFARRPSSTPYISTITTTNVTTAQHSDLQRIHRFHKFKRFHSESSKDKNPAQRVSGTIISSNDNLTTLLHPGNDNKRKVSMSGLEVEFSPSRPVSRCHIDINVTEAKRTNEQNDEKQQLSTELETNNQHTISTNILMSPLKPIVQISEVADVDDNNDNNSNNDNNNNTATPSIQILIDTLETAKNEIPDKLELPKMSVREQRRRSALCRVNSKQVDDFLLVHNLKDLGLL